MAWGKLSVRTTSAMTMIVMAIALTLVGCENSDPSGASGSNETWKPTSGLKLTEPKQLSSKNGVLEATLEAAPRTINVSGSDLRARPFAIEGSEPQLNGPTLHVRPGDTIKVKFKNNLGESTNIHYHGLHVSPLGKSDNVFRDFKSGKTYDSVVNLPKNHPVGTYWYHIHPHGLSELQVMGGLSGLLIVEGIEKKLPQELQGITQRQLAFREIKTLDAPAVRELLNQKELTLPHNSIISNKEINSASEKSMQKTTRLVNGLLQPKFELREGEIQLWRMANIGSNLFYAISLQGHPFYVIAEDGNPVFKEVKGYEQLVFPPGKRFDVLVQGQKQGKYELQTIENGKFVIKNGRFAMEPSEKSEVYDLAQVTVTKADSTKPKEIPKNLQKLTEDTVRDNLLTDPEFAGKPLLHREFTFSFGKDPKRRPGGSLINGKVFDMNELDVSVHLDSVEEWTLLNVTEDPHPFHIHVNEFQVVSINGQPYEAVGMQDVVTVPPQTDKSAPPGKVVIRTQFKDFPGWFVFHCHILNHEDDGMMQSIQVLKPGEKPAPPPHDETSKSGHQH